MTLNNLTIDNMGSWPWLIKLSFTAVIIFFFSLLFYLYDMKPMHKKIADEQLKKQQGSSYLKNKTAEAATLSTYERQAQQINKDNFLLLQRLPCSWNIPQLIQTLSHVGENRGLTFKAIKPQPEIIQPAYIILPIHMTVQGNYYQLGRFVADLTQLKPIIILDSFTLELKDAVNKSTYTQPIASFIASNPKFTHGNYQQTSTTPMINQADNDNTPLQMTMTAHIYRQNTAATTTTLMPIIPIKPLPSLPDGAPISYNYPDNLSPFNPPMTSQDTSSLNQSDSALQRYPFSAFAMVGTLTRDTKTWALIMSPDGQVLRVGVGDTLGLEKNSIIAISPTDITLEVKANKDMDTSKPNLVYLALKSR